MRSFAKVSMGRERFQFQKIEDISDSQEREDEKRPVAPRHHIIIKSIKRAPKRQQKEVFEVVQLDTEPLPPVVLQTEGSQAQQFVEVVNLEDPKLQRCFENKADLVRMTTINKKIIEKQMCAICLSELGKDMAALLCGHNFCLTCITESAKFSTKCPYCREEFSYIMSQGQRIAVETRERHEDENFDDQPCYVCGRDDRHDRLLVCDICEYACCHIECDQRLNGRLPSGNWYCNSCSISLRQEEQRQRGSTRLMRNLMTIYRNTRA